MKHPPTLVRAHEPPPHHTPLSDAYSHAHTERCVCCHEQQEPSEEITTPAVVVWMAVSMVMAGGFNFVNQSRVSFSHFDFAHFHTSTRARTSVWGVRPKELQLHPFKLPAPGVVRGERGWINVSNV